MKIVACTNDIDGNADTDIDNDDYAEIDDIKDDNDDNEALSFIKKEKMF